MPGQKSRCQKWRTVVLFSALACAVVQTMPAQARKVAQAGEKELLGTASGLSRPAAQNETRDGAIFLDKWLRAAEALKDYSFNYSMTVTRKNGTQVTEKGTLSFKHPRLLRIEETAGPKSGSVAVLEADGKVHAHMGGALKMFTVSLDPDSSMLRSVNGWPMAKTDFISLAVACKGYIKDGATAKVSAEPVPIEARGGSKFYDWELDKADGTIFKRALFEPQTMQPVEWWDYVDGKLFAHSLWTNFKPNQGLSEQTFTMKGDK